MTTDNLDLATIRAAIEMFQNSIEGYSVLADIDPNVAMLHAEQAESMGDSILEYYNHISTSGINQTDLKQLEQELRSVGLLV